MKKSDANIILMIVGLLLAAGAYFGVYKNLTAETETMQKANAELKQEVQRLQELADNKQQYLDDTDAMLAEIEEIKKQFPAQYLPEDEILYMINAEKQYDAVASRIAMNATTIVEVAAPTQETQVATEAETTAEDGTVVASTEQETAKPEIQLYRTPVSVEMLSSYLSLKDIIKMINVDVNRKSIDNISVAFDSETGELLSNVDISMYSLTGTEAEYVAPKVDSVVYGTSDIFNSAKRKAAVDAQKAAALSATE